MKWYVWGIFFIAFPSVVLAEDFICTRVVLERTLYGLIRSQDPTNLQVQGCIKVGKGDTAQQRVIESTVPVKYRKLENNLMVEMTANEKTTADVLTSAEIADAAIKADTEAITTGPACTATKAQIEAYVAALATIADVKQFLVKLTECVLVINGRLQP